MIRIRPYIIALIISLSFAQENPDVVSRVATSAANWLKIETGTRAIGMSGAFTSVDGGIAGIPYNPASLTFVKNQEGFLSTTDYFAGITHNVLGYASNMSGGDFASMHVFFLDSGSMPVTTVSYNTVEGTGETFSFTGLCLRATYGRIVTNRLRIGFTGKFIREQIYTTYMQSFAFDIGSHFDTGLYGFKLGMSISNLGPEAKYEGEGLEFDCEGETPSGICQQTTEPFRLPMTFRIGFSNMIAGPESELFKMKNHSFMVSMDAINPIDYILYGSVGMEYSFRDMFFLRAGTHFEHDTAEWSVGAGLAMDIRNYRFGMDYAYVNYGVLDYTHQFGLNFEF